MRSMVLDGIAAMIILVPILLPIATSGYGIDPVQFGIVTCMTLVLGLLTPPVGAGVYIASALGEVEMLRLSRLLLPFIAAACLVVVLVIFFPMPVRPF